MAIAQPGTANWGYANLDDANRARDAGFAPKNIMNRVRIWDTYFEPVTEVIMPPTASPNNAASFNWAVQIDEGGMSPRTDLPGSPELITLADKLEQFHGKITKYGIHKHPKIGDYETPNLVGRKTKALMKTINRRIEFDALRYLAMDQPLIAEFSTQNSAGRGLTFNVLTGADSQGAATMTGAQWDDYLFAAGVAVSNPLIDIDTAGLSIKQMTGEQPKYLYVGPNTFTALANHPVLNNLLQFTHKTLVDEGARIAVLHGITIVEVRNFYKEFPNSALLRKAPGRGDWQEDTWAARRKVEFMRDFTFGQDEEFAILTTGKVGGRFFFTTDDEHGNGREPFVTNWIDENSRIRYWAAQKGYGFFVEDFGNIRRLDRVAQIRY